jgi:hypothetical protein
MRWCRRRAACYFPQTQTPRSQALSTVIRQKASDLRKHCARGGTRTAFQPVQIVGTPENISAPSQSGRYATQSEAKSVDSVNTSFLSTSPGASIRPRRCGSSLSTPRGHQARASTRDPSCGGDQVEDKSVLRARRYRPSLGDPPSAPSLQRFDPRYGSSPAQVPTDKHVVTLMPVLVAV